MPRINIDDTIEADHRFWKLSTSLNPKDIILGSDQARGMLVRCWRLAMKFWADGELIPKKIFMENGLMPILEANLAVARKTGIYVRGSEDYFKWYTQRVDASRKSATQRKGKSGRRRKNFGQRNPNVEVPPVITLDTTLDINTLTSNSNGKSRPNGASGPPVKIDLISLWNENCGSLPKVKVTNKTRAAKSRARATELPDPEVWVQIFKLMAQNPFLNGSEGRSNWRASFDWIIANDSNYIKVREGNYDRKRGHQMDIGKMAARLAD